MPAQNKWLARLPEIIAAVERASAPVIDRAGVESLFGVKRRRAIELMHCLGGFQSGAAMLVDRAVLLLHLRAVLDGDDFARESRRRQRLREIVEKSREDLIAAKIRIPISQPTAPRLEAIPGVHLWPGVLSIEFGQPVELLQKLFDLARAIAADYAAFETRSSPATAGE